MKTRLLVLLFTVCTCYTPKEEDFCEKNWISFESQCILIKATGNFTKYAALSYCLSEGGVRVSISSLQMLEFLTIQTSANNNSHFWVGLTRTGYYVTRWEWLDGTSPTDQPWVDKSNAVADCFVFTGSVVQPENCFRSHGVICTKPKQMYNPVENCLSGLTRHSFISQSSGECVYRTPEASNRENATTLCQKNGGRFMDLDEVMRDGFSSFHEHKVMMDDDVKYWTDIHMNGSNVHWRSGEAILNVNFTQGKGDCVTASFHFTALPSVQLHQMECKDQAFVICSVPTHLLSTTPTPTPRPQTLRDTSTFLQCPKGSNWKTYAGTGHCYWETSFETSRLTWDEAQAYCRGMGAELASFESVDEEKIGLSFQYGSLAHSYWIGLRLDPVTETYNWSDGTPLTYQNWAPHHPNHRDKRLQCVQMNAIDKHWVSSFCGMLSWFVCEAPKRANQPAVNIPRRPPLQPCDGRRHEYYHKGFCYRAGSLETSYTSAQSFSSSWHRAKQHCENLDSYLVSIHSDDETAFLLRLLHEDTNIRGTRAWIGLNNMNYPVLRWADYTPVDFTFWSLPSRTYNMHTDIQAKCTSMDIKTGYWVKQNCNEEMSFVCKRAKDANVTITIPTTIDPTIGNCNKGWYPYDDRCYLLIGYSERDRANWTEAQDSCQRYGGYLVSIRNNKEQAFLTYLMQGLKGDTWIGMGDRKTSRHYYWLDNTDLRFTNWALGEPSFFGWQEDCVKMAYNHVDSGVWMDEVCHKKLSYICYTGKDPELTKPTFTRGLDCIHPEGWLKLDHMCFKMFAGTPLTWQEAEEECEREGAHLISLSGQPQQAVANYLGAEVNASYWIGLQFKPSSGQFSWLNEWPVNVTKWDKHQPISPGSDTCFSSSWNGYWRSSSCKDQMPFICQISAGNPPAAREYRGNCPKTSELWVSSRGSYCHLFEEIRSDWFFANFRCFKHGSHLPSFHSKEELQVVKKAVTAEVDNIFIGLMKNEYDGFHWTDGSPVDFVNWDQDQPQSSEGACVEMKMDSLKWRVVPCEAQLHFVCWSKKDQVVEIGPENARYTEDSAVGLSAAGLSAILVCTVLVILAAMAALFFRPTLGRSRFRNPFRQHSISYENALYNVDSSSMEFQNDTKDSCDTR